MAEISEETSLGVMITCVGEVSAFAERLRERYHKGVATQALSNRNFSKDWALAEIEALAETYLPASPPGDPVKKLEATIRFLAILAVVERDVQRKNNRGNFQRDLRDEVIACFGLDQGSFGASKTRDVIYHVMNQCVARLPSHCHRQIVDMKGVASMSYKEDPKRKAMFGFSRAINKKKSDGDQVTLNIWLGKIPTIANVTGENGSSSAAASISTMFNDCHPGLIVSAVAPTEFLSDKHDIAVPAHFVMRGINQICLPRFIDFGRPYRDNPTWDKAKHPRTGAKFESKEEWNTFLDGLYEDIYRAHRLMEQTIADGKNVYVHCKAGKGRSVMVLASYLVTHPDHLLATIDAWKKSGSSKTDCVDIQDDEYGLLATCAKNPDFAKDPEVVRKLTDIVWKHMVRQRGHIDKDDASKQAVIDCVQFIYAHEVALKAGFETSHSAASLSSSSSSSSSASASGGFGGSSSSSSMWASSTSSPSPLRFALTGSDGVELPGIEAEEEEDLSRSSTPGQGGLGGK